MRGKAMPSATAFRDVDPPHCGQWSHTVESSLRRLALCPAVGTAHCEVMELASKLWSWAQLHNLEFQKSPTVKFWSWAGFCQGRLWHQLQCEFLR